MALHGGLLAEEGSAPSAGFLASARNVKLAVARLDDVAGALQIAARRLSCDDRQILYEFTVQAEDGRMLAEGRECREVVMQISAATKALEQAGFKLIAAGLTYCVERPDEAEADGYALEEVERMFLKLA